MPSSLWRTNKEIEDIYARHHKTVYRVCFLYMKNRSDTEDLVQNVFLRLMRDKTTFASEEHEKAWLIRTASNACKNELRSRWRKTTPLDEGLAAPDGETGEILSLILALPPRYKTPLYLHYYEGYSSAEIAMLLGSRESTVRSWLMRGRNLLKLEMECDDA